jgi:hypothetical protein
MPPESGSPLFRALSLSLAHCPVGPTYRRRFLHPRAPPLSLSRGPGSLVAESLCRASPFLSLRRVPILSDPPRPRRGPTSAHSCTSPDFSATTPAHVPNSLLRAAPVPRSHPASFHAAPPSLALCPRRQQPPETRTRIPGHRARWRPRQASPSSAPEVTLPPPCLFYLICVCF